MQSNNQPPDTPGVGAGDGYEVGYRKPPKHTRFRSGRSGNPAGRRRGVRNLMTDVKRTLSVPVKMKENGRARKISTQEGALMLYRMKKRVVGGVRHRLGGLLLLGGTREPLAVDGNRAGAGSAWRFLLCVAGAASFMRVSTSVWKSRSPVFRLSENFFTCATTNSLPLADLLIVIAQTIFTFIICGAQRQERQFV